MRGSSLFLGLFGTALFLAASDMKAAPPAGMAAVPPGSFTLGDPLDSEADAPLVSVYVSGFYMDTNLVSSNVWQPVYAWGSANGYSFSHSGVSQGADYPVQTIDWYDALKWCNARSQSNGLTPVYYADSGFSTVYKTGEPATVYANWTAAGYRLPTEAEWEKAARGGLSGLRFPLGDEISFSNADYTGDPYNASQNSGYSYDLSTTNSVNPQWYVNTGFSTNANTSTVGYYTNYVTAYGQYDMMGNVYQWCWDFYSNSYPAGPLTDPRGPASGTYHVVRGGSWDSSAYTCRCAYRGFYNIFQNYVGFRTVVPEIGQETVSAAASPSGEGSVAGEGVYANGATVTNTATANSGYSFIDWTMNGSLVSTNASYVYTIDTNQNLVANFGATITVSSLPAGIVSYQVTVPTGSPMTVAASFATNYNFVNWTVGGGVVGTSPSYCFTPSTNETIIANLTNNTPQAVPAAPTWLQVTPPHSKNSKMPRSSLRLASLDCLPRSEALSPAPEAGLPASFFSAP